MKTDAQLKKDVSDELEWDPSINANQVGVAVKNGVVTLTGHLDTYAEKYAIEQAVGRVEGVNAIAIEIDVNLEPGRGRSDSEIAEAAELALKWHAHVPADRIQVKVEKGWVVLKGEVDWDYERKNAEKAVRVLNGVVGVSNAISLKAFATPADVAGLIRSAFSRHAQRGTSSIEVIVEGSKVTLRGTVNTWAERNSAANAAWAAPGVTHVENEIKVQSRP